MGLVKRTYVDGETVITAENLNDIQDAIIQNEQDIATKGTYSKPFGGIPASDTASGVQTSLGKADTAYQKPSGGIPATDMASGVQTSLGKAESAYQKPSEGIPSTDLASAVQTSLGKADTALQSSDIDSTLTVTGKAADAKKTGDEISDVRNTLTQLNSAKAEKVDLTNISQTSPTCTVQNGISAGTYFYLDGVLARAKTLIGNGADFTEGTNYEEVSTGALNELESTTAVLSVSGFSYGKIKYNTFMCCIMVDTIVSGESGGKLIGILPFLAPVSPMIFTTPLNPGSTFLQINRDGKIYVVGTGDGRGIYTFMR